MVVKQHPAHEVRHQLQTKGGAPKEGGCISAGAMQRSALLVVSLLTVHARDPTDIYNIVLSGCSQSINESNIEEPVKGERRAAGVHPSWRIKSRTAGLAGKAA